MALRIGYGGFHGWCMRRLVGEPSERVASLVEWFVSSVVESQVVGETRSSGRACLYA